MSDRKSGIIKRWNDDRGFGFIEVSTSKEEVFLHIKAFRNRTRRPAVGDVVTFHVETDERGKYRALGVDFRGQEIREKMPRKHGGLSGLATLLFLPAFAAYYIFLDLLWKVPPVVRLVYLAMCTISVILYILDKAAAASGNSRVAEKTLHFFGLLGGWPAALVMQQLLRHKTVKAEFRAAFWGTVFLNCLLLAGVAYKF